MSSDDPFMVGLSLVHLRFCELAALMNKFSVVQDGAKLALQWSNITANMRKPGRTLIAATRGSIWEARVIVAGHAHIIDMHLRLTLIQ